MRIVQVLDTLRVGGAQKMQVFLAQSFQPLGIELTVVNLSVHADPELVASLINSGARVVSLPFPRMYNPVSFFRLVRFFRREKFDLIHAYLARSNIICSFAGLLSGIPVIASLRSVKYNRSRVKRRFEDFSLRHLANLVMANGEAVGEFARTRSGKTPVDVVVNAVDLLQPPPALERDSFRVELVGDAQRPIVLSVGRLTSAKGFFDLLDAFKIIHDIKPHAALVIAGGGALMDNLLKHIRDLDLQNDVFLLGLRHDVPRLLAAADIYVNSSHWEGTPVSVLEAMSAGLPVVATTVGESPFLLRQDAGLLVPPSQPEKLAVAIISLLDSPLKRHEFGLAAQTRIRQDFSRQAWIRNILNLYARIIPQAGGYLAKLETAFISNADRAVVP